MPIIIVISLFKKSVSVVIGMMLIYSLCHARGGVSTYCVTSCDPGVLYFYLGNENHLKIDPAVTPYRN